VGALESEIIRAEQTAEPRGVRRAAQILEQERIEQCRAFLVGQSDHFAQTHPDEAGPDRVALGLSFRDVEGVTQSGNDFR
jgi:hypothetical protein